MERLKLSTDVVAERDRLPFWRDAICDAFVELECDSAHPNGFFGAIDNKSIGSIQFSNVVSSAQHVVRTRSKISQSTQDYYLISIQTQGRGVLSQDGRVAILEPGDFALYDTTRPYDLDFQSRFSQTVLRVPRNIVNGRLADVERLTALRIPGHQGVGRLASAFLRQLHAEIADIDPISVARLHGSAIDLLATAIAEQVGGSAACSESQSVLRRRISAFIDANLGDAKLNCERIAAAHGISERPLRKTFETSGMSVSEWIWTRRLDQARRDLVDPLRLHVSVTAVGYDVGFKDAAHFSRAFKAKFGETPSACRAAALSQRLCLTKSAQI